MFRNNLIIIVLCSIHGSAMIGSLRGRTACKRKVLPLFYVYGQKTVMAFSPKLSFYYADFYQEFQET